jgi:gamma-butyrobetaine dioxygenase
VKEKDTMTQQTPADVVTLLEKLFAEQGAGEYLGEAVTQAEHMLQAAACAQTAGASNALVAAALLHDVGHFSRSGETGEISGHELMTGTDNRHSHAGADWLAAWFPESVTEPVRLHVAAKRYLCAVEPGYFDRLSEASVYTLSVQGGPMSEQEAATAPSSRTWSPSDVSTPRPAAKAFDGGAAVTSRMTP